MTGNPKISDHFDSYALHELETFDSERRQRVLVEPRGPQAAPVELPEAVLAAINRVYSPAEQIAINFENL